MTKTQFTRCDGYNEPEIIRGKLYLLQLQNQFFCASEDPQVFSLNRTSIEYVIGQYAGNGQWKEYVRETAFYDNDGQPMTYYTEGFGEGLTTGVINEIEYEIRQTIVGFMEIPE